MHTITLSPLTPDAFAPYGHAFDLEAGSGRPINAGTSERIEPRAGLDLMRAAGQPALALFRTVAQSHAGPWTHLERHRLGSQTFVPLDGAPWIVIVATGATAPDLGTLSAFAATGRQAVTIAPGVWHHPLVALARGNFLVLERQGPAEDCDVVQLAAPVVVRSG